MHQFAFGQMKWKCTRYAERCAVVATLSCIGNIYGQIEWVSPANGEYCNHLAACKWRQYFLGAGMKLGDPACATAIRARRYRLSTTNEVSKQYRKSWNWPRISRWRLLILQTGGDLVSQKLGFSIFRYISCQSWHRPLIFSTKFIMMSRSMVVSAVGAGISPLVCNEGNEPMRRCSKWGQLSPIFVWLTIRANRFKGALLL